MEEEFSAETTATLVELEFGVLVLEAGWLQCGNGIIANICVAIF
jgi:hypothetical protein